MRTQEVYIAVAKNDEKEAEKLAIPMRQAGYDVAHNGTLIVGDSFVGAAEAVLNKGFPIVLCATTGSMGSKFTKKVIQSAQYKGSARIFIVQMESDADLSVLAEDTKVALYYENPAKAIDDLVAALKKHYPLKPDSAEGIPALPPEPADYLDQSTGVVPHGEMVAEFRSLLRPEILDRYPATWSDRKFLDEAGFMANDGLTRAGSLIFGKEATIKNAGAQVQCVWYAGANKASPRRKKDNFRGPLFKQIVSARKFVEENTFIGEFPSSRSSRAVDVYGYPMVAVREIIANALVHRDYTDITKYVHVRLYSDRLEISSPGTWLGQDFSDGAIRDLSELEGQSVKRNARLAHVLSWIKLVEEEGSGVPAAMQDCREWGVEGVKVAQGQGFITVTFPGPGTPGGISESRYSTVRTVEAEPRVWNIPARNPGFVGRDDLVASIREALTAQDVVVVQAFQGIGGVGKTQLAIEYAHRFASDYKIAWWVDAEQPGLIGDQFAALGAALGGDVATIDTRDLRSVVAAELNRRGRWLLVFDNADNPAEIRSWLPSGGGHVLITSRTHSWAEIAVPVQVDILNRAESTTLLRGRVPDLDATGADRLAAELGDLPLALAQAAAYIAETGMSAPEYLGLLRTRAGALLDQGASGSSYPRSLAAAIRLAADRLDGSDPAAGQLASLCAFYAPEAIPLDLFTSNPSQLPDGLADQAADPLAWRRILADLSRQSLAQIDARGLTMHRLVQAILRDQLTIQQTTATLAAAEGVLAAADPGDPINPATWPRWTQLIPHLLAADLAATSNQDLRQMAVNGCRYLLARGDTNAAYDLSTSLRQHWRNRLGDDDLLTLAASTELAMALRAMGRYPEARELAQDTLARYRGILGDDHPDTLTAASNLAADLRALGEVQAARELDQDTLAGSRRVLGDDHPDTLTAASNLAADLRALGEVQAARELDQDTLAGSRRVLGDDHPDTLTAASNLAADLRALGEVQAARELDQDTLAGSRRVLGDDHPDTLTAASNLAADLRALGEVQAARELDQDTLHRRLRILGPDHPATLSSARRLAGDASALE